MGILKDIDVALWRHKDDVFKWFAAHEEKAKPPIYASVDIRNSGYKLAAVDTNLFPAGFNNVYARDLHCASSFVEAFLTSRYGKIRKILIVPEDHTRNTGYLRNVVALKRLFSEAGYEVEVGTLNPEMRKDDIDFEIGPGESLRIYRAFKDGARLKTTTFDPDFILINNDFSQAPPAALQGLVQPIAPPVEAGWHSRRKSRHFELLHQLINEFAAVLRMDPWMMQAETVVVRDVDINTDESRQRLAEAARNVLEKTRQAYTARGIKEEPYVFLKDNSGTYGFAVMTIKRPEEVLELNSKARRNMSAGKGGVKVNELLIQEGIPTKVLLNDCPAEPVIYLAADQVIGGFFRQHCDQDEHGSLNVKGSIYSLLTFASPHETKPCKDVYRDDVALHVYGSLARIAYLAVGYEIQELTK